MRTKSVAILAPALALGVLAVSAEAQQHKATRLGNPATRFAKPLKKADDLRVLLRTDKMKADVPAILNEVGWKGNHEDLDRAAASAEISAVQIAPGTRLPFMSSRKNKKPHALMDVLWAGQEADRRLRVRVLLELRALSPRDARRPAATSGSRTSARTPPTRSARRAAAPAAGRLRERRERDLRDAAGRVRDHREEPAGRQQREALRERQGARLRQAHERRLQVHLHRRPRRPGTYEVKAVSGGVSGTTTVQVKPCLPTCGITASPLPAKAGKPFTVDVSGSRVAAGVKGGVKTAKVEVVDPKGAVVGTYDLAAPNFVNNAVVIKKGGIHTLRAVVTDEAGQVSTNACTAQVDVKGGLPIYVGAYFGKERLVHDDADDHDDDFVAAASAPSTSASGSASSR